MTTPTGTSVEKKVQAATAAGALSTIVAYLLNTYVFGEAMPDTVEAAIFILIVTLSTFTAGYLAPHTPRHGLNSLRQNNPNL
jgi:hypothetical protein